MEIVYLETGTDLEEQVRRLNLHKRRSLWRRLDKKQLLLVGIALGVFGCAAVGFVLVYLR